MIGDKGIGKTTFITNTINQMVSYKQKGYIARGKCNHRHINSSFFSIKQALNELVLQLLTLEDSAIDEWTFYLPRKLGKSASILVNYIPNMNLILKCNPSPNLVEHSTSKIQFKIALKKLIGYFYEKNIPLIFFIDDLQWVDQDTADLIRDLIIDEDLKQIMFIFAGSESESDNCDKDFIFSVKQLGIKYELVKLEAFTFQQTHNYIDRLFQHNLLECELVSYHLFKKTSGHPLFLNNILVNSEAQNLLVCSKKSEKYLGNIREIEMLETPDYVKFHLTNKITQLPQNLFIFLKFLAVFGASFSGTYIKRILSLENTYHGADMMLNELINRGLLITSKQNQDTIEFVQDDTRRNLLTNMSTHEISALNYKIGIFMLKDVDLKHDDTLKCVDYLNKASDLVIHIEDVIKLVSLNLEVGLISKNKSIIHKALHYFKVANNLIINMTYDWSRELIFEVQLNIAKCECLTNNFKNALSTMRLLEKSFTEDHIQIEILLCKANFFAFTSQYESSQRIALKGLSLMGVIIPTHPTDADMEHQIIKTLAALNGISNAKIMDLPQMTDEKELKIFALFTALILPTFYINTRLFETVLMEMCCRTIQNGNSAFSPITFAGAGILFETILSGHGSNNIHDLVKQLSLRYSNSSSNCIAYFLMGASWTQPFTQSVYNLDKATKYGFDSGNILFTSYAMLLQIQLTYSMGDPLSHILEQCETCKRLAIKYNMITLNAALELFKHHISYLQNGDISHLQAFSIEPYIAGGFEIAYYLLKAESYYFASLYNEAESMIELGKTYLCDSIFSYGISDFYFYEGLILAKTYSKKKRHLKEKSIQRFSQIIELYKELAEKMNERYEGKWHLLIGEWHTLHFQYDQSIKHFKMALAALASYSNYPYKAIAFELMGSTFEKIQMQNEATRSFEEAINHYTYWECQLRIQYLSHKITGESVEKTQANSVNKLEQAGQEIPLEKIENFILTVLEETNHIRSISNFLEIVYERFNPDNIALLVPHSNFFYLLSHKSNKDISIYSDYKLIKDSKCYPFILFKVVNKCNDYMVYDYKSPGFLIKDSYFENNQVRFAYCFPITRKNNMIALIYLEFNQCEKMLLENDIKYLKCINKQLSYSKIIDQALSKINNQAKDYVFTLLSNREQIVLKHMIDGQTNKEIAKALIVSENTVKTHVKSIFRKLEVNRRVQVANLMKDWSFETQIK